MSEMTSKDRVLAAFKKQPVDRAPVITGSVYIVESMDRVGAKWPDLHKDPAMMLKVASVPSQYAGTDNI
ncbi:MAG: uroporphyrinogen decarboxylase family protein, partial [Methermicoccaceae archaeon]